jgi:hypothetical protein
MRPTHLAPSMMFIASNMFVLSEIEAETQFLLNHRECIPKVGTNESLLEAFQKRKKTFKVAFSLYINGLINYIRQQAGSHLDPSNIRLRYCGSFTNEVKVTTGFCKIRDRSTN